MRKPNRGPNAETGPYTAVSINEFYNAGLSDEQILTEVPEEVMEKITAPQKREDNDISTAQTNEYPIIPSDKRNPSIDPKEFDGMREEIAVKPAGYAILRGRKTPGK